MKKFFIISFLFFITSAFMTAVFAGMAGEQGMKNYFVNVIQDRMNCVDANWEQHKVALMGADEIQLESISTDMKFEPSGSADIEIEFAGQTYDRPIERKQIYSRASNTIKFNVSDFVGDEQKLQINFNSGKGLNLHVEHVPLLVRVPKQIKKIKLTSVSGNIKIVDLSFDSVQLDSISGDIRFKNSDVKVVKLQTTSGDLKFTGKLGDIEATSVSGDIKFELQNNNSSAKIVTTSGDVKVELVEKANFEISFSSTSGSGRINDGTQFEGGGQFKPNMLTNEKAGLWKVQTVSGDFRIEENSNRVGEYADEHEKNFENRLNAESKVKKCSDFKAFGINFK